MRRGYVPLNPFAGDSIALLGKDRKPARLQTVRRWCSFITFSFVGFLSEVSCVVPFLLMLFLLPVLLFEWFSQCQFFWLCCSPLLFGLGGGSLLLIMHALN